MLRLLVAVTILATTKFSYCQSVGTTKLSEKALSKFTLVNPVNATDCYLIDNCGFIVKKWDSDYRPGLAAYLDSKGNLYRAGRIGSNTFRAGGLGGSIEKFRWNGAKEWEYILADKLYHLHHDFYIMNDGKLMLVAWELISFQELVEKGRTDFPQNGQFYSEKILLIDPENNFNEVWSWRAIDHIIQYTSDTIDNYGLASENPRKLDINLNKGLTNNYLDWLHINSVDVNEKDSLIMLSCNGIEELIVIEFSKNQSISNNSFGGRFGFGGDLLFRWGNYANFSDDTLTVKRFFSQHDVSWLSAQDFSTISVFNNGRRKENENYSTVDIISFEESLSDWINNMASSELQNRNFEWSYNEDRSQNLYSKRMSSAQWFEGNWIICSSDNGRIIEVDSNNSILWEYINPVGVNQIFNPDETPFGNVLFAAYVYDEDYFDSELELMISEDKIELGNEDCIDVISSMPNEIEGPKIDIINSHIFFSAYLSLRLNVYDMSGKEIMRSQEIENGFCLNLSAFPIGLYAVVVEDIDNLGISVYTFFNN